ncbi:uncharacterized protein PAC_18264 [Phialocephala subalpina]|uniref:NACHT domain-containing protein n=1 Tax=Phialocephala subalpina TaxID=576137 RepID=A0A1L7XTN4_9HELO|nr:uncharacterized protein PAC_18264 [Phialocephala subalpina]
MDPLTAIGLASNILSFLDFSVKVFSGAIDIYDSPSGLTEENRSSEAIVAQMKHFASKLQPPDDAQLTGDEKALCKLACECDDLSTRIIALIEKARPKDRKSKSASILAGLKSKWHEAERRKLEERLGHCRAQLALQLNYLTSSEVKGKLDILVASAKDDSSRLEQLSSQVNNLGRDVTISSLSPMAQAQIETLLGVSEHAVNLIAQQHILKSLAFEGMYGRYETVNDAHYKTFRWIFGHDSDSDLEDNFISGGTSQDQGPQQATLSEDSTDAAPEEADRDTKQLPPPIGDPEKIAARNALLNWLSSGNGIFHISGKLGSGKSTLMKYLCEHKATIAMLKNWAVGRNLVFANFFFWKPGSSLQKSLTGLFRSLLHDILQTSHELIQYVLPDQWRQMKSSPWHAMNETRFSDRDIQRAFLRLISDAKLYKDYCFCFFIDGLDEYEGTLQDDTKSLVDQLCYWTTIAPNNVKLCVSSREYNVFMNAFPESRRIRLHQLTRSDMKQYVVDKLSHMDQDEDKAVLTRAIVDNAHGIFQWVIIVTKRIREQIENGSNVEDLKSEIDNLPQELDDLFAHLLNSLSKSDLKRAYQTFAMVLELKKQYDSYLPLPAYSFLDDYNRDTSFALQEDFGTTQIEPGKSVVRANSTLKRLNGCCKGLVEAVSKETKDPSIEDNTIEFTHRSVPEFLSTKARRDHMLNLLEGFNPVDAFSQLALAALLTDPHIARRRSMRGILGRLVLIRTPLELDTAPYLFLESLSEAIARARVLIGPLADQHHPHNTLIPLPGESGALSIVAHCVVIERFQAAAADLPQHPIYQAAYFGNWEYVRWGLRQHLTTDAQISLHILLNCILKGDPPATNSLTEALDTVEVLISRGLTPQALTDISFLDVHAFERHDPKTRMSVNMTVWQHLLLTCYTFTVWRDRKSLTRLGCILERYLEHGADPYFLFHAIIEKEDEGGNSWVLRLVLGREQQEVLLKDDRHSGTDFYSCEANSLAEFIELFDFENKDRILRLIERNTEIFESTADSRTEAEETGLNGVENPEVNEPHEDGVLAVARPQKTTHFGSFPTIALIPISAILVGIVVAVVIQLCKPWLVEK